MRIENPEYPFDNFVCYKNLDKRQGRWMVHYIDNNNKKRSTIQYAKYLMSIKVGRILSRDEEVDHIDGNKLNDSLDNIEIVSREENRKRYAKRNKPAMVDLICDHCGSSFSRRKNQTYNKKKFFCCRECLHQSLTIK